MGRDKKRHEINPINLLKNLNLEAAVDPQEKTVCFFSETAFNKAAEYFDRKGIGGVAFFACGWLWISPQTPEKEKREVFALCQN